MDPGSLVLAVLAAMFALAGLAPLLVRWLGRGAGYALAGQYAAAGAVLLAQLPAVLADEHPEISLPWVPGLEVHLSLRLDGLSLLFSLLVLGIGALVMAYSARYMRPKGPNASVYGQLTLFAAAMLGLVLAADVVLLFVFWELTTIASFFLIGGRGGRDAASAAMRAFLVTGLGGLALLAGLLLMAVAAGTTDLTHMLANPGVFRDHGLASAMLVLVLLGAFTKSAQFPFHFWLPGAMVAPTPVSTYLHAATMVKAGVYLLARFSPVFAGTAAWLYTLVLVGLLTAVFGAGMALRQYDLKALLAYSTVSQLGLLVALVGVGTFPALAAAAAHTLAHACYKATLFMVVGIIDREAGSRDIRRLSGLRRAMPITATVTGMAGLSMAGLPPLLGFVSKEEAFAAFLMAPGGAWLAPLAAGLAVVASIMTFAYGARIFDGAFGGPLGQSLYEPARAFIAPAAVVAVAGLALGIGVSGLDPLVDKVAEHALGRSGTVHLALWHGLTPALGLSAITITLGAVLFLLRRRVEAVQPLLRRPLSGESSFDRTYAELLRLGKAVGRPFLSTAPGAHLVAVFATAAASAILAWAAWGEAPAIPGPAALPVDWAVAALLAVGVAGVAMLGTRIAAVAVLGTVGFLIALLYVVLGGPDLALTQLLVETLTVTLVVLVFRRLPRRFARVRRARVTASAVLSASLGVLAGLGTFLLTGHRELSPAGEYYLAEAESAAGGTNVVNTILVDFRALDTLGEITVLAVAAVGVFALATIAERRNG